MKHLTCLSKSLPSKANAFQDASCSIARTLYDLVELKGATAPVLGWIDGKCTIPTE